MKTLSIFIFFFLLVLPSIYAEVTEADESYHFQLNKAYDFKRPCFNNGTFCTTNAVCNITMSYPDGTLLKNNQRMTNQVSYHNVTVNNTDNRQMGKHPYIMSCTDGSLSGAETGIVWVTSDGRDYQSFPTELAIAGISFLFVVFGSLNDRWRLFIHMGSIGLLIFGIITLYPGYSFINWTTLLGKAIGMSSIGLGFYFWIQDSFSRGGQSERFESDYDDDDGRYHQ